MTMAKTQETGGGVPPDPTALGRGFKRRLKTGPPLLGAMAVEYLRPSLVKIFRNAGFDFIFVEKEHGMFDGSELPDFVLCARDNGIPVISKVGDLNRPEVARLLDAGVVGIQLPRTESAEQVAELVDLVKYPPLGSRAGAPGYGGADYTYPDDDAGWLRRANASTAVIAHIETMAGLEDAAEIIATPHLDMVYVGPYDTAISLGHPGEYDHPDMKAALGTVLDLCLKHGVAFGTTPSGPDAATDWVGRGCRFFELVDELALLHQGARATVAAYGGSE
jgi:2-dehydro-3-deoxyglucarate aldolase/4-hydroxy-2-oxoheptanedioate aldolase